LLALLSEDNEQAFRVIFDRHRDKIYRLALMYVKAESLAEDIVQDIFLKLWTQRKELSGIGSLESWIHTLTRNHTLNHLKKIAVDWTAREALAHARTARTDTTDYKVRSTEYEALFKEAVGQLPDQQKRVYLLAKEEDLSYAEIGAQLSLSPLTVKTHMARAFASIRGFFRAHDVALLLIPYICSAIISYHF
jgi:RNA polymerase sigma-70 factor (ECF subfamily)